MHCTKLQGGCTLWWTKAKGSGQPVQPDIIFVQRCASRCRWTKLPCRWEPLSLLLPPPLTPKELWTLKTFRIWLKGSVSKTCYLTIMVDLLLLTQPSPLTKSGILQNKHDLLVLVLHWKWRGNWYPIPCLLTDTHTVRNHFLGKNRAGEGQCPQKRNRPLVQRWRIRVRTWQGPRGQGDIHFIN